MDKKIKGTIIYKVIKVAQLRHKRVNSGEEIACQELPQLRE
jgi:hypothetical protein